MKATLHYPQTTLASIIASWKEEHANYYGRHHGSKSLPIADGDREHRRTMAALTKTAPWALWWDTRVRCGFTAGPDGSGAWVRSSGAWLLADPAAGTLNVMGRRHSIRERLPREAPTAWRVQESQRSDLPPWETATP